MKRRPICSRSICIGLRLAGLVVLLLPAAGCVHRQLIVQSNPPGAIVEVNGKRLGPAPADYPIRHYGVHEIRLLLPGYETAVVNEPIRAPWYEWPGLDFVSENLVPWTICDIRRREYTLQPLPMIPAEAVLERSEQFRQKGRSIGGPPLLPTFPGDVIPDRPGMPSVSGSSPPIIVGPIPDGGAEPLPPPTKLLPTP